MSRRSIYLYISLHENTPKLLDDWNAAEFSWTLFYLISDASQWDEALYANLIPATRVMSNIDDR